MKDEILAEAFSDEVDDILLELSKMSLFKEASENSIPVHMLLSERMSEKKNLVYLGTP